MNVCIWGIENAGGGNVSIWGIENAGGVLGECWGSVGGVLGEGKERTNHGL